MFPNEIGKKICVVIKNNTVPVFEIPNIWVSKLIQRPKFNEFGECENQISVGVTW